MLKHKHALQRRGHGAPATLPPGVSWTQKQKLARQANKVGVPGISAQQPATVNIFDTVVVATSANRQTLTFFSNAQGKSKNFTNWANQTYYAGESLLCTHIWFTAYTVSSSNLTADTTTITSIPDNLANSGAPGLALGILNFNIGNTTVIKNFNTFELIPAFNPAATGLAATEAVAGGTNYVTGASKIRLEANPAIVPNIQISATLDIPPVTLSGTWVVSCYIGRTGTIYNPGGTM